MEGDVTKKKEGGPQAPFLSYVFRILSFDNPEDVISLRITTIPMEMDDLGSGEIHLIPHTEMRIPGHGNVGLATAYHHEAARSSILRRYYCCTDNSSNLLLIKHAALNLLVAISIMLDGTENVIIHNK